MNREAKVIIGVAVAELLVLGLWFSATAVLPQLVEVWSIAEGQAAWLTMSVQLGFVVGAVLSSILNLPDRIEPRVLVALSAVIGALANLAIAAFVPGFAIAVVFRFFTGFAVAGVYPVGMKIIASWTTRNRGLAIGILVGALTVGSASPHLLAAFSVSAHWRVTMTAASVIAILGGLLVLPFGHLGPHVGPAPKFEWNRVGRALGYAPLRLANGGYLGHMWELYAMWTWVGVFAARSLEAYDPATAGLASLAAFLAIGIGGPACAIAGRLADRFGRTAVTIAAMAVSGTCCIAAGLVFGAAPWVLFTFLAVWGFAIVADSAQFSTAISELADTRFVGTQLTAQTAMGFLLTVASIRLIPVAADMFSWRWAFAMLALGPLAGIISMGRLRRRPESVGLAAGKR